MLGACLSREAGGQGRGAPAPGLDCHVSVRRWGCPLSGVCAPQAQPLSGGNIIAATEIKSDPKRKQKPQSPNEGYQGCTGMGGGQGSGSPPARAGFCFLEGRSGAQGQALTGTYSSHSGSGSGLWAQGALLTPAPTWYLLLARRTATGSQRGARSSVDS